MAPWQRTAADGAQGATACPPASATCCERSLAPCLLAASPVDSILDKESYTLEELLDEDELIQECKSLNARLTAYLKQKETVDKLVRGGAAPAALLSAAAACSTASAAWIATSARRFKAAGRSVAS